ncbi:hypothetical protein [Desulfitobacterium hafniense]|uniref:hypothetical protein n=1 Tax=Desulfitobacterium hafniense TaxID=49338 RepID=UPI0003640D8E|nr:hypothetical protein [Desulfitobacterium hafniense]
MLQKRAETKVNELIIMACDGLMKEAIIDKESFDAVSRLIEALNSGTTVDSANAIGFHAGSVDPEECDAE